MSILRRLFLFGLVAAALPVVSAEDNNELTNGSSNGRRWKRWNDTERSAWILGFIDGLTEGVVDYANGKASINALTKVEKDYLGAGSTVGEISEQITKIFSDPVNGRLQIYNAAQAAAMKFNGKSDAEVEAYLVRCRKFIAENMK